MSQAKNLRAFTSGGSFARRKDDNVPPTQPRHLARLVQSADGLEDLQLVELPGSGPTRRPSTGEMCVFFFFLYGNVFFFGVCSWFPLECINLGKMPLLVGRSFQLLPCTSKISLEGLCREHQVFETDPPFFGGGWIHKVNMIGFLCWF